MNPSTQKVILKTGKEKAVKQKHHWIFSGAIATLPRFEDGEVLPVYSAQHELLGHAVFNHEGSIRGRMISFGAQEPLQNLKEEIHNAITLRKQFFDEKQTNAYRLINGEGDRLPGLVVDKYADYLVIQIGSYGMERLKPRLVEWLKEFTCRQAIYEKSKMISRREEGMKEQEGWLCGTPKEEVEVLENGLRWIVPIVKGQKTGLFLDQREMRQYISSLSSGKRVLNCFCYTGGFSLYALRGKAQSVDSVDISQLALEIAQKQVALNQLDLSRHRTIEADVFEFLRKEALDSYDLIILDPPAFTKKKGDVINGCRGYKEINRITLQKMAPGSLLLTCSCSYYVDPDLFQTVIFQAAHEAKRKVKIIGRHIHSMDHPINLFHKEGDYLKSLLLYVE